MIKKIIFDNDGVNIDSEHIAMRDMAEFGFDMVGKYIDVDSAGLKENDIYVAYKGQSANDIFRQLVDKFSLPEEAIKEDYNIPDGEDICEYLSDLHTKSVIAKFTGGQLETVPGFRATIESIRNMYGADNIALCTTSRADRMHATFHAIDPETAENAGWDNFFPDKNNLRLSGYGYPNKYVRFTEIHPDWHPEETAIIEDTAGSTKKAIQAGFKNIIGIVVSTFQCHDDNGNFSAAKQREEINQLLDAGASVVVTNYADISAAIAWIDNGLDASNKPDFNEPVYIAQDNSGPVPPVLDI